ncbi:MAG TPA: cupin domain-containing protein [Allosphingosinicella sp.]|nr:cupin domain-containing protein [Allosphingosinicella sp.]
MPKLDLDSIPQTNLTGYPSPWREEMAKRHYRRLGPVSGLSDFGISHVTLEPGGVSSQRHWHEEEDEFVVMLEGEAVLVEDEGETMMRPGDCASFPKGAANGHRLINRGDSPCVFIAIGKHALSNCHYPDIDLFLDGATSRFTRKDRTPY